jgi:hypothetical protein
MFADFFTGTFGVMSMDDVDPEVFGTLVHYIYTQRIYLTDDEVEDIKAEDNADIKDSIAERVSMLSDLWSLAGVCMMKDLQNDTMKMLFPLFSDLDGKDLRDIAVRIYNGNVEMTQLKKAVVEKVAFGLDEDELSEWMAGHRREQLPDGMLVDLVMALKRCAAIGLSLCMEDYFV